MAAEETRWSAAEALGRLRDFLSEGVWQVGAGTSGAAYFGMRLLQFGVMLTEGFFRDRLLLRATALAYVTALSLIPLLALAVSLVDTLGFSENVTRWIVERIAGGSPEAVDWILRLLAGVDLGRLGPIGASLLFATTVLAIGNFERALNDIWGVRHQRTWTRRLPDYLAVLVVAPLLLGVALSLRTTLETQWLVRTLLEVPLLATLYDLGLRQAPTVLLTVAFAFLFWFLPNTEVRPLSALLGGVVAAILFNTAQSIYLGFNVGAARYSALFGAFAVLPLFLVWIYFSWAIVLFGAEVAFAHQNVGRYGREVRARATGAAEREAMGLAAALAVARAFGEQGEALSPELLAGELDVPVRTLRDVLADLERAGLVARRAREDRQDEVQLARPAEQIAVADVLAALRGRRPPSLERMAAGRIASQVVDEVEQAQEKGPGGRTLAELLQHREPSA